MRWQQITLFALPIAVLLSASCQSVPHHEIKVSSEAFNGKSLCYQKHADYVAMPLPYPPMQKVLNSLQNRLERPLISRGEAHVTVLTPPEFSILKKLVSIQEIDAIAEQMLIQASDLEPICLGKGEAEIEGKKEQAYFIVVRSENLLRIRRAVQKLWLEKGGAAGAFAADHFYPHITVGFTKSDLHEQQGVIKNDRSCYVNLSVSGPAVHSEPDQQSRSACH